MIGDSCFSVLFIYLYKIISIIKTINHEEIHLFTYSLILLTTNVYAQPDAILNFLDERKVHLSSEEKDQLQDLRKNDIVKTAKVVHMKGVSTLLNQESWEIPVSANKAFRTTGLIETYEVEGQWTRAIDTIGEITIYEDGTGIHGYLRHRNQAFAFVPLGNGDHTAMVEFHEEILHGECGNKDEDQITESPFKPDQNNNTIEYRTTCTKEIDILYLYTSRAQATGFNPTSVANTITNQLNTAAQNSDLAFSDVTFSIASVQFTSWTESENWRTDIDNLPGQLVLQSGRKKWDADIVVVLTKGIPGGGWNYDNLYGVVNEIESSDANAYSIVEIDHATMDYTGTHEVGHIIGGHHEDDTGSHNASAYILPYTYPTKVTIMTSGPALGTSTTVIPHFSNPDVTVETYNCPGFPDPCYYLFSATGTSTRNVANKILTRACEVSEFSDQLNLQNNETQLRNTESSLDGEKLIVQNPVFDRLILSKALENAKLLNSQGIPVKQLTSGILEYDLSWLPPGIYILRYERKGDYNTKKIIKL